MTANIDTITEIVECPDPSCRWIGQLAACGCAAGENPRCPLCRCPVEMQTDEPVIIHSNEPADWNPMAITK